MRTPTCVRSGCTGSARRDSATTSWAGSEARIRTTWPPSRPPAPVTAIRKLLAWCQPVVPVGRHRRGLARNRDLAHAVRSDIQADVVDVVEVLAGDKPDVV